MVIGLITILAMLGATFLIVAHLEQKSSKALAGKAPADPIAEGIVAQLKAVLKADLYIDSGIQSPYGQYAGSSNSEEWRMYVDYPSTEIDSWLTSNEVDPAFKSLLLGPLASAVGTENTDGDGTDDAHCFDTLVRNAEGQQYWAAVRVTDLGGLINVNTAAQDGGTGITMPSITAPVSVNLREFLKILPNDYTIYDNGLHSERCGAPGITDLNNFYSDSATKLLSPTQTTNSYLPFAIGDEMYLRWPVNNGPTYAGRLFLAINGITADKHRNLTTFNCSRILTRHPIIDDPDLSPVAHADGADLDPTNDYKNDFLGQIELDVTSGDDERQAVYRQMFAMLTKLGLGTNPNERKRMAAHFVANLWAYQDIGTSMTSTSHWAFTPFQDDGINDEPFTVYGLTQDLAITEAYARHDDDVNDDLTLGDYIWGYAVEIMNPTGSVIDLNDFELRLDSTTITFLAGTNVTANGGKVVVYNWGTNDLGADETDAGFPASPPSNWVLDANLDFTNDPVVTLVRVVSSTPTTYVPIDQFDTADPNELNYSYASNTSGNVTQDIRRDDRIDNPATPGINEDRARYNIAAYLRSTLMGINWLDSSNGLTDSDLAGIADNPIPIRRSNPVGSPISNLGECGKIYLNGPILDGTSLEAFPKRLFNLNAFPDGTGRGRLDFHPNNYSGSGHAGVVPSGGWSGGDYPDLPAASFLSEFFTQLTSDTYRGDGEDRRIYGQINLNTATADVFKRLPWPSSPITVGTLSITYDIDTAVNYIIAYRDMTQLDVGGPNESRDYSNRTIDTAAGIINLRNYENPPGTPISNIKGYISAAEVAIPLADYVNTRLGWADYGSLTNLPRNPDYLESRDSLYTAISNLITVNSDVYAANIVVQLRDETGATPIQTWRYISVIDRSNCRESEHEPAVLLFAEVK